MDFSDDDLHAAMKSCLDTLLEIIHAGTDYNQRGNAAISLANILIEIYDRNHPQIDAEDFLDIDEDDDGFEAQ